MNFEAKTFSIKKLTDFIYRIKKFLEQILRINYEL